MILNLIFTKLNQKKQVKTTEEYRHEETIQELLEQTKLKNIDMTHRRYY